MKGMPRSLSRGRVQLQPVRKHIVKMKDVTVNITDGAPGKGTAVIGDLPEGNILLLGVAAYVQLSSSSAGITTTFDGDFSIGTAPDADGSLSGTEVDLIASTALGAATAKVSPRVRAVNATQAMLDNTDNAMELNLNVLIDDAAIDADSVIKANGVVELAYIVMLDD